MAQSVDYTPIVVYKSETAGNIPAAANLRVGELAVNIADGIIYTKNSSNEIISIGMGSGSSVTESEDLESYIVQVIQNNTTINNYFETILNEQQRPTVIESTDTSYTISASDETNLIRITNTDAITVNVPADADDDLPIGFIAHVHTGGVGLITVVPGSGVTVNSSRSLTTDNQYSALSLFKVAEDDWVVVGDQQ